MDLKTITATLALLGSTTMAGCDGDAKKEAVKTETKTEVKEVKTEVKEVKAPDAKEVSPAKTEAKGEMKCGEGKCGEGACGGKKTEGDGKAVPVDAAKTGDAAAKPGDAAAKPAEKPADKS
jgi:outer membrane murein-binding lipoprotein Lpp